MPSNFITIESSTTQGALGALTRAILFFSREAVAEFTPDPQTGLIRINSTDLETFITENPTSVALINSLTNVFSQNYSPDYVYVLSEPTGITTALLNKANKNPRSWSFITVVDQFQGDGEGATGGDTTAYFNDLETIGSWLTRPLGKLLVHTYSVEQADEDTVITLPTELQSGGSIRENTLIKSIVCNSRHQEDEYADYVYDNIAVSWMAYNLNGVAVARSWGSLSDSHDYEFVSADTYNQASRSLIENNSLAQYNGAKDRAGSAFVYDTQMNDETAPPETLQIETQTSIFFIEDYVYVYVRNALQAAGQTGLPTDNAGIQKVSGLVNQALKNCYDLGTILSKVDGSPDYSVATLTAAQVTVLSPTWQTTGVWPSGVVVGTIRPFAATHYITINFAFQ
jgi:hypothetical protein